MKTVALVLGVIGIGCLAIARWLGRTLDPHADPYRDKQGRPYEQLDAKQLAGLRRRYRS